MANGSLPLLRYLHRLAAGTPGADVSDGQLLERFVRQQDETAFTLLLRRHAPMVWGVCSRLLRTPQDAEDAFQATFMVLVRKAGVIAEGERLAGWLHGVAVRVAKKAQVQSARRLAQHKEMEEVFRHVPTGEPGWKELSAVLDDEVQRLPVKYREPLVLCYLEGLSNEEVARRFGCAEGTLRSWLSRARDLLRQRLHRRGLVVPAATLAALLADNAASGAVTVRLVDSTLSLAHTLLVTGQVGSTSASVAALTKGVLQDMVLIKLKTTVGILAAGVVLASSVWVGQRALAQKPPGAGEPKTSTVGGVATAKGPHASKLDLSPKSFAKIRAAIQPQGHEWRHLEVHWYTDIVAARKKAAAEDKPILVFRTGGAGYNDPLGQC